MSGSAASLAQLGIFFAGLGVLFVGCAAFWAVAVWKEKGPRA
ncbi:hypothetical protein [Martelella lutilitoris]|nr:hypothetical protein [Martelella lutilitoris]